MENSASESIHVLHVDDEPEFADLTETYLMQENENFVVETVQSATAGLEMLNAEIDCIVSDYDMPDMDGIAFLEAVREEYLDLPFILFTGKGSEKVASDAISAGVTDYLQKQSGSSQFTVLANRIENAVHQYDAERRANQRKRELERQNKSLEEFASIVSHDLRTPLSVAVSRLELAQDDCESPHLDDVSQSIDRMSELLDTLSTLARSGKTVTTTTWTDLDSVARDAWKNVETAEMELIVDGNCQINADLGRLQQLFENLFENSITHADGDVTVTVGSIELVPMATRSTENTYQGFYVADDGPGIPEEQRSEVLDWGITTADEGTGYGLAIVSQIAEAHNWEITVTESVTGGAEFQFSGEGFRQPTNI